MQFITFCEGTPIFEVLPVLKTRHYIGDFKPLMYLRAAFQRERGLWLDFMKFERDPVCFSKNVLENSCVGFCMQPAEQSSNLFRGAFDANGSCALGNGEGRPTTPDEIRSYNGVDEQGWYWGVRVLFSPASLPVGMMDATAQSKKAIKANFYTFLHTGSAHFGAVAPVQTADHEARRNLADFAVSGA